MFRLPPEPHNASALQTMTKVPLSELTSRMQRFRARMDTENPGWELAALFGRVNQYDFTGTMQDGVWLVPRDGQAVFWVRRSYERASEESLFPEIRPMKSYRDAAQAMSAAAGRRTVHLETELVPLALAQRFRKHFPCKEVAPWMHKSPTFARSRVLTNSRSWSGVARSTGASWKSECRRCCGRA
jgi:hypothetical protein